MSEMMNRVSKANIRASMNLVFTQMKFISMLLELAPDNLAARETLVTTVDSLFQQTAVMCHDVLMYTREISVDAEGVIDSSVEIEGR